MNTGVSHFRDYVENIYDEGHLCLCFYPVSIPNPYPMYLPLLLTVLYLTPLAVKNVTRSTKHKQVLNT